MCLKSKHLSYIMEKTKYYYGYKFPLETIIEAHDQFLKLLDPAQPTTAPSTLEIRKDNEEWRYDNFEEFIAEYKTADRYYYDNMNQGKRLLISGDEDHAYIVVKSGERSSIQGMFQIFENKLSDSIIVTDKEPIKIFIGHGHDEQWRYLKDHLHDKHGLEVITYEIGPRAGLSIKEVLESMLSDSSFALLVLTGEDVDSEGIAHARENVIHELGLFQGKIGFKRAIALLEKGVSEFSNILGINHISFSKGNIKETFGEIISIIQREFK